MKSRPRCDSSNLNHASMFTKSFSLDMPATSLLSRRKPQNSMRFSYCCHSTMCNIKSVYIAFKWLRKGSEIGKQCSLVDSVLFLVLQVYKRMK